MITSNSYKNYLLSHGSNIGEVRKNQSDVNMNLNFMTTPEYKRAYILTSNGWEWVDIHYFRHGKQSISSDEIDSYIMFRPKIHYKVGSYIIIPDDNSSELNLTSNELKNPFLQPIENRIQWWIIVEKSNDTYAKYNILPCSYNFKWIYNGKIQEIYGCIRSARSYTSGTWAADYSVSLDELNGFWVTDTFNVYGSKLEKLGMCDTRTIAHENRMMITNNDLYPKCYIVSKVNDLSPEGIIKVSVKQDDYNEKTDNIELKVCDYYSKTSGQSVVIESTDNTISNEENKFSYLVKLKLNSENELEIDYPVQDNINEELYLGKTYYYNAVLNTEEKIRLKWRISLIDIKNEYNETQKQYYENLIKLTEYDEVTLMIKTSKANSLLGKQFLLSVCDINEDYYSSAVLEVVENE